MTAEGPLVSTLDYFKQDYKYLNTTSSSVKKKKTTTQEQEGSKRGRGTGGEREGKRVEKKEGGKD